MPPQPTSQYVFGPNGSGDTLHFEDATGRIVSWIDSNGAGQGNLAGGGLPQYASYTVSVSAGTVSARNNSTGVVDYSGADASVVLNNVLSQISLTGGTVLFKNGTYNFNSATQESVGGYSHYYCVGIPSTNLSQYPMIRFLGESGNFGRNIGIGTGVPTATGVVFNVTAAAEAAAGAGNVLAAFWMRPNTDNSVGFFWNSQVFFENISIQFPANTRGKEIGFYMLEASYASFINVSAEFVTRPVAASAAGNTAYVSPATPSDGIFVRNSFAHGWEVGFEVNTEHSHLEDPYAFQCGVAYWYGRTRNRNASNIIHCSEWFHTEVYDCINGLKIGPNITQGAMLNIYGFDLEYTNSGAWSSNTIALESPQGISGGTITLTAVQTNVGLVTYPSLFALGNGGQNYKVIQPGFKPEGNIINSSISVPTTQQTKQTLKSFTVNAKTFLYNSYSFYGAGSSDGGDYFRIRAWGITAANGNSKTVELDYGGNTISTITTTANAGVVELEAIILTSGVANNAQECIGKAFDGTTVSLNRTLTAVDTSASTTIVAAATTATASGDFILKGWTIEYIVGTH